MVGGGGAGWWGGVVVVANKILVSAQGPLVFGFGFWGLGPGLDNSICSKYVMHLMFGEYSIWMYMLPKKCFTGYFFYLLTKLCSFNNVGLARGIEVDEGRGAVLGCAAIN